MGKKTIKILGEEFKIGNDFIRIDQLKFLRDNPRVYDRTRKDPNFDDHPVEEQQQIIYDKLLEEPSVKNLIPDIKRHGGLIEPILVRMETMQVIEGNSRLAVYRKLRAEDKGSGDNWDFIACDLVSGLNGGQQAALLSQIHVKGKTQWSAYEKANFAYVRKVRGQKIPDIKKLFGEAEQTIRNRIKAIEMMTKNGDSERAHFSYYYVLVRKPGLVKEMKKANGWDNLLEDIKQLGADEDSNSFTARELRDKLPVVIRKPKVLKKYIAGDIDLDAAYQRAKISGVEENLKKAINLLGDVSSDEVRELEQNEFNSFKQAAKRLFREDRRITGLVNERDNSQ